MTYISDIPRCDIKSCGESKKEKIRIAGSPRTISPSEVSAVLDKHNSQLRPAVEQILAGLNHANHPESRLTRDKSTPKNYIDSPETALNTLELLLDGNENNFNRSNTQQATKIALGIMVLLSEYYGNQENYSKSISRDNVEQNMLRAAQQKLTDTFHFVIGNIIDRDFQVSHQLGEISLADIIQDDSVLDKISNSQDFPNIKRALELFRGIHDPVFKPHQPSWKEKAA